MQHCNRVTRFVQWKGCRKKHLEHLSQGHSGLLTPKFTSFIHSLISSCRCSDVWPHHHHVFCQVNEPTVLQGNHDLKLVCWDCFYYGYTLIEQIGVRTDKGPKCVDPRFFHTETDSPSARITNQIKVKSIEKFQFQSMKKDQCFMVRIFSN